MNDVKITGRLTAEPNLTYSQKKPDMAIAKYTLAVDKGYGDNKKTIFVNCVAFGKAGEFVSKYFHKGQKVLVSGELDIQNYEKDGVKKSYTQIITDAHEFADSPRAGKVESTDNSMNGFTDMVGMIDEDEVPF